ncbi:MAG: DUF2791 family P-loop domain-containing protein [Euryarchaeota archaeon]|nr:DUF2791 family P-loop domain-containing protein [Euryarchaeota archaeon]MDE1835531.1 DUF2791 family P-loop domain-containing protein [Euryarchaeota archaeon]MDE1879622.1 DUF2791 family P-loop domain-containing protein [Euryarchaeota archaeon]MDE2043847.1 DUF2791 family P-loop domain-containing protein [Thermoplasmata archaeon]
MAGYPVSVPLIGRETEKALLERVLDGTAKGRGGLLLISGPPGSGKSRMLELACDLAVERGFVVFQGHASEGDARPYLPFRRALENPSRRALDLDPPVRAERGASLPLAAAVVGSDGGPRLRDYGRAAATRSGLSKDWGVAAEELFPPSDGKELRLEELPAVAASLRVLDHLSRASLEHPVVVALDNFHWADPSSRSLLRPLAREARKRSLLVAVSYDAEEPSPEGRPGDGPTMEELAHSVQRESGAVRLTLRSLSDTQVLRLTEELLQGPLSLDQPGKLPPILARANGNPFFVQEIVRAGLRDGWIARRGEAFRVHPPPEDLQVPTLLRWWVHRRIQVLMPEDRNLLEAISVLGSEFDPRALPALLPELAPKLKRALERLETRYALVHPVRPSVWQVQPGFLAAVVRSEMSGELLRRLHRRAGEWHAAHDPQAVERIAMHYHRAQEPVLALPWLDRAWKAASDRGDLEAQLRYAREGEELARSGALADALVGWERRVATSLFQTGDAVRAVTTIEHALETSPPGLAQVELLCELALLETHRGNPEKSLAILNRADSVLVDKDQRSLADLRIRIYRCEVLNRQQRWEEVCREVPRFLDRLDEEGAEIEPRRRMGVRISYATALVARGEFAQGKAVLLDALSRARRAGHVTSEANVRTALGILAVTLGDLGMAKAIFEQASEEWRRRGALTNQAINLANAAEVLVHMGDLEPAKHALEEALELCEVAGLSQVQAMTLPIQARCLLELGDPRRAEELLRPLLPAGRLLSQQESSREAHATMAQILLAQGKVEEAWSEAQQAGHDLSGMIGSYAARTYAVVQAARGESSQAEGLLGRIAEETARSGRKYDHAMALEDLGDLLVKEARYSAARAAWNESLGQLRASGALARAVKLEARRNALPLAR